MSDILNSLLDQDKALFSLINGKWTHPVLDVIMPWLRHANNWIPLYIALLLFLIYKWGKTTWKWLLVAALNVAISDQISSSFFKPFFGRLRPCQDPAIMYKSRLLIEHCMSSASFTSSHATNHFVMGGALLGIALGYISSKVYERWVAKASTPLS